MCPMSGNVPGLPSDGRRLSPPRPRADYGPVSEQAPDWQAAVDRLGQLSDQELDAAVTRSAAEFADAEGHPDPLGSYPLHAPTPAEPTDR
jgi:hypothetical protein